MLVGSGNLSRDGLDAGCEVFTQFRAGERRGDSAIATWRLWMRRLIELIGDVTLAERFKALEQSLSPAPSAAAESTSLLHNLDESLADQLLAAVHQEAQAQISELLLAAPFWDADVEAAGYLLHELKPSHVTVYVTGSTSVNGDRLARKLSSSSADVTILAYEPDRFVHAKLVGVVAGRQGWLLSGSANLSRAALSWAAPHGGNVELGRSAQ